MKKHEGGTPSAGHYDLLLRLCVLPQAINVLHHDDAHGPHTVEYIFHELCGNQCFGLRKAAYLIDNPDFDMVRGVAGYACDGYVSKAASHDNDSCMKHFASHLQECDFNESVRELQHGSVSRNGQTEQEIAQQLAKLFGFSDPQVIIWEVQNDNNGVFVYEGDEAKMQELRDWLVHGMHLLSLCPTA